MSKSDYNFQMLIAIVLVMILLTCTVSLAGLIAFLTIIT